MLEIRRKGIRQQWAPEVGHGGVGSKQDTKCRIYALQLGNTNTNIEMSSVNKISITNNL